MCVGSLDVIFKPLKATKNTHPTVPPKASAPSWAWCIHPAGGSSLPVCAPPPGPTTLWWPALVEHGPSTCPSGPEWDTPSHHRTHGPSSAAQTPPVCIHESAEQCGSLGSTARDVTSHSITSDLRTARAHCELLTEHWSLVDTDESKEECISRNGFLYTVEFLACAGQWDSIEKNLFLNPLSTHHSPLLGLDYDSIWWRKNKTCTVREKRSDTPNAAVGPDFILHI